MCIVERLVQRHRSRNPFQIADSLGYIVIQTPLVDVRGFYQYIKRNHFIYLDSNLSEQDALFVCAHELGHSMLHRGSNRVFLDSRTLLVSSRYENEADIFASHLLISDDDLMNAALYEYTIPQIAKQFGIPEKLIRKRFDEINKKAFEVR